MEEVDFINFRFGLSSSSLHKTGNLVLFRALLVFFSLFFLFLLFGFAIFLSLLVTFALLLALESLGFFRVFLFDVAVPFLNHHDDRIQEISI